MLLTFHRIINKVSRLSLNLGNNLIIRNNNSSRSNRNSHNRNNNNSAAKINKSAKTYPRNSLNYLPRLLNKCLHQFLRDRNNNKCIRISCKIIYKLQRQIRLLVQP